MESRLRSEQQLDLTGRGLRAEEYYFQVLATRAQAGFPRAHAVVLEGYQASGAETVAVEDPWYGPSSWDYQTFQTAYQDSGSWTVSRFTK